MSESDTKTTDKKVTATDRRAIEKLLEEDFALVQRELVEIGETAKRERTASVRAERSSRSGKAAQWGWKIHDIIKEAGHEGFQFGTSRPGYTNVPIDRVSVTDIELEAEIKAAVSEVQGEISYAVSQLHRKLLDAKRQLLLGSLSGEALALLNNVPSASALLAESRQHRAIEVSST